MLTLQSFFDTIVRDACRRAAWRSKMRRNRRLRKQREKEEGQKNAASASVAGGGGDTADAEMADEADVAAFTEPSSVVDRTPALEAPSWQH